MFPVCRTRSMDYSHKRFLCTYVAGLRPQSAQHRHRSRYSPVKHNTTYDCCLCHHIIRIINVQNGNFQLSFHFIHKPLAIFNDRLFPRDAFYFFQTSNFDICLTYSFRLHYFHYKYWLWSNYHLKNTISRFLQRSSEPFYLFTYIYLI